MTPEFIMLAFVLVLALVQIGSAGAARTAELGGKWNAGPRDGDTPPPGKLAGRLLRAQANLFETLPIFAAAVIMAHIAGKDGQLTFVGAHLYFFGRLLYLPLYAFGVPYIRSLVWLVATGGLVSVIVALFL
ncbi:MAG: MAPEG family protein [Alphaproteobacteria bacterium]|nr:MAPEG family protein [Alphaproteobacteria bacterium]MBU2042614.1 MAPEG family protein [Alphaproteobacteria bacterium]MBU2125972.1 MAPEG family protein [Alphaproteobacteria bacterium]MBU2209648.1 MAPEG family protein [Alphaproteobacteria bacterium]MBU2290615.1 MAPEG family protein [Alphaproteobacteria bacterium]